MKTLLLLVSTAACFTLLVSDRTHACIIFNFSDYLTSIRGGVIVSYDDARYVFDDHGNFRYELPIPAWDEILGMSADGSLWVRGDSDTSQTIISNYTSTGTLIREYQLNGKWHAVIRNDVIYLARSSGNQKLEIEILDPETATTSKYVTLVLPVVAHEWEIGENGFVCTTGFSGELFTLTCFDSEQNLQWSKEYQGSTDMFDSLTIDSKNNIYVVGAFIENRELAILQFDSDGALKGEFRNGGIIFAFAMSDSGSIFLGDPDKYVTRLDQNGKFQERWDASYLEESETWIERRDKEHAAQYTTEFSTTEDLITTALYGNPKQRQKVTKALIAKGPQIVPAVFEKCMLSKGFSEELLQIIKDEFPEETVSEMAKYFPRADPSERERLLPELIDAGRYDVSGLVEFVEKMSQSNDEYEREFAQIYLVQMGKGHDVLQQYWKRFQSREILMEESAYMFSQDLSKAIQILETALLNPQDPAHESAKENLIEAVRLISFEERKDVLDEEIILKINGWANIGIPDIAPLTSILLLQSGNSNELKRAIQFAERDPKLASSVVRMAVDVMTNSAMIEQEVGSRIYALGARVIFEESDHDKDYYNVLLCKKLMYFEGFRSLAMSVALKSIFSSEPPKLEGEIISKFLAPELISSSVVFEFLADGIKAESKYWDYLELIAKRFQSDHSIKHQIRSLILSHLSSESEHLFRVLSVLRDVGESQDSQAIMDLLTNKSNPCPQWIIQQALKTLAVLGGDRNSITEALRLQNGSDIDPLPVLLDAVQTSSSSYLNGSMLMPFGREAEDGLISKLKSSKSRKRQEILVLLAEMRSSEGLQMVQKEFDESIEEGQFPTSGVVAAAMIYGEDPWLELLEQLSPSYETCNESMLKWFPETMKLKASKRIGELMLQENDRKRFDLLECWLNREAFQDESGFVSEWVRLKHPNPKMRKNVTDYF